MTGKFQIAYSDTVSLKQRLNALCDDAGNMNNSDIIAMAIVLFLFILVDIFKEK